MVHQKLDESEKIVRTGTSWWRKMFQYKPEDLFNRRVLVFTDSLSTSGHSTSPRLPSEHDNLKGSLLSSIELWAKVVYPPVSTKSG